MIDWFIEKSFTLPMKGCKYKALHSWSFSSEGSVKCFTQRTRDTLRLAVQLPLSVFTTYVCRGLDLNSQPSASEEKSLTDRATGRSNELVYRLSTCFRKINSMVWYMVWYTMLGFIMECMVCYGFSMLWYEFCMLCYPMIYVIKDKHSASLNGVKHQLIIQLILRCHILFRYMQFTSQVCLRMLTRYASGQSLRQI